MGKVEILDQRRPLFTPATLASYLAVSERQVRNLVHDGKIKSFKVEGSRRFRPEDVDSYLDRCEDQAA